MILVNPETDAIVGVDLHRPAIGQAPDAKPQTLAAAAVVERIVGLFRIADQPDTMGRSARLIDALSRKRVRRVFLVGLGFPCSVGWTACDLREAGLEVFIVSDALPSHTTLDAGDVPGSVMEDRMKEHGIQSIASSSFQRLS